MVVTQWFESSLSTAGCSLFYSVCNKQLETRIPVLCISAHIIVDHCILSLFLCRLRTCRQKFSECEAYFVKAEIKLVLLVQILSVADLNMHVVNPLLIYISTS